MCMKEKKKKSKRVEDKYERGRTWRGMITKVTPYPASIHAVKGATIP